MPLHVRSIAVSVAVIFFFGLSLVGWIGGLSPFTCCKRSLVGAVVAYMATAFAVKAVNAIMINAMIKRQISKQKEKASDGED
jgi:hypothetical protein